ncbi:MAG: hypothetical protein GY933_20850, partial [Hyphomicrobiales bacterium]|nr:hypothetical protein [Hyphomicrobiales bacterium]
MIVFFNRLLKRRRHSALAFTGDELRRQLLQSLIALTVLFSLHIIAMMLFENL